MFTSVAIVVFTGLLAFGVLFLIWRAASVYFKFRGSRVVTCPKTAEAAGVEVNAKRAAISGAVGIPALQLNSCSRWPENQDCGQGCLAEIEGSPESCLVRTILTRWYEKKSCVYCGTPLGRIDWLKHKPALMNPERVTFEWREIQAEKIPEVLATHTPVCWNCHIAETFRCRYPRLVVDRPWKPGESHRSS
jgi:hypothetical protein